MNAQGHGNECGHGQGDRNGKGHIFGKSHGQAHASFILETNEIVDQVEFSLEEPLKKLKSEFLTYLNTNLISKLKIVLHFIQLTGRPPGIQDLP